MTFQIEKNSEPKRSVCGLSEALQIRALLLTFRASMSANLIYLIFSCVKKWKKAKGEGKNAK